MLQLFKSFISSVLEVHIFHAISSSAQSKGMSIYHFFTPLLSPKFSSKLLTSTVQLWCWQVFFFLSCQKVSMEGFQTIARIPFPPQIVLKGFIDWNIKGLKLASHDTRNYNEVSHTQMQGNDTLPCSKQWLEDAISSKTNPDFRGLTVKNPHYEI